MAEVTAHRRGLLRSSRALDFSLLATRLCLRRGGTMRANTIPLTLISLLFTGLVSPSLAQPTQPTPAQRPCVQITAACRQAGFASGGYHMGVGLTGDCIQPIMRGVAQRKHATKALPQIDPQVVAACKEHNPDFGMGGANR